MSEIYPLTFSDVAQKMCEKLDAAARDLYDSIAYGAFIIKNVWKAKPWGRGSTYLLQSAFLSSMVVSYARAFARSYGWPKLPAEYLNSFDAPEMELHGLLKRVARDDFLADRLVRYRPLFCRSGRCRHFGRSARRDQS